MREQVIEHIPEHLTKRYLRAIHNLYINKDGTIRYDMTEMPLTHFTPELEQKLRVLGYDKAFMDNP